MQSIAIKKMRRDPVVDFAAEELKKYLRMMMPEGATPVISDEPGAADGFRLGLLSDFGLPDEAPDPYLDDVVHVDAGPEGGVLAGSNPRSVLFAVYRFLRLNGCRWLYPGPDGEFIPEKELEKVSYHKMADMRFRGHCNEGSESQECMLETIDFYPKQEINVYMMEFSIPFVYYDRYYSHSYNEKNRIPEPVTQRQVLQWKRQCECEIEKRGLQFHDMGHGWTADPFGMKTGERLDYRTGKKQVPENVRQYLAMINGERKLFRSDPLYTNLCYSNPAVRSTMADAVVDYSEKHPNVTYLHIWLGDLKWNHCECEECKKKTPSDWYVDILNEIDEKLEKKGLDTRIVFIAYVDTIFPPEKERIKNPKRFSLLFAPISRSYTSSVNADSVIPPAKPYVRNAWPVPTTSETSYSYLEAWRKVWGGPCFVYEYHFWRHQYHDLGGITLARRIYEDIRGLKGRVEGFIEDGSQRSFFPNGFPIYVYAETLANTSLTFEEIEEDYFSHAYGKDWKKVAAFLEKAGDALGFAYMEGECGEDPAESPLFAPSRVKDIDEIPEIAAALRAEAAEHRVLPVRVQTLSYRLLDRFAEYADGVARIFRDKALGYDLAALEKAEAFFASFGRYETEIERYFDHGLACLAIANRVKTKKKKVTLDV